MAPVTFILCCLARNSLSACVISCLPIRKGGGALLRSPRINEHCATHLSGISSCVSRVTVKPRFVFDQHGQRRWNVNETFLKYALEHPFKVR